MEMGLLGEYTSSSMESFIPMKRLCSVAVTDTVVGIKAQLVS